MQDEILHTFCIAAYGESPYLEDCLKSICAQSRASKIIVSTSSPNQYIADLASRYQAEYKVSDQESGIGRDWNFAYRCAITPLVTIAHQDDVYHLQYTEQCLNALKKHNNILIIFTDLAQLIGGNFGQWNSYKWSSIATIKRLLVFPFWFFPIIRSHFFRKLILMFGNPIPCASVMLNKNLLGEDFAFDESLKTNLDWQAWLVLVETQGAFYRVPKVLYYHRIHRQSATSKTIGDNDRMIEDRFMFEKIWGKKIAKFIMYFYKISHRINDANI